MSCVTLPQKVVDLKKREKVFTSRQCHTPGFPGSPPSRPSGRSLHSSPSAELNLQRRIAGICRGDPGINVVLGEPLESSIAFCGVKSQRVSVSRRCCCIRYLSLAALVAILVTLKALASICIFPSLLDNKCSGEQNGKQNRWMGDCPSPNVLLL